MESWALESGIPAKMESEIHFNLEGTGMEHLESGIHRAHIAGAFRADFAVFCGAMAAIDLLVGTLEQNDN